MKYNKRMKATAIIEIVMFVMLFTVNFLPFGWGIITSLKSTNEILVFPPKFLNFNVTLDNYRQIINNGYLRTFINSVFYALSAIAIDLVLGFLAAYGFQRFRFKGKKLLFALVIAGIPLSAGSTVLLIPNYVLFSSIGFTNHWYTLVILYAAYNLPMATWIMKGGLELIPVEIEEACIIDGGSRLYILGNLLPTLCRPTLASAALFVFIGAWNEYITAAVMINKTALRSVQMSIYDFLGFFGKDWGALTAAATLAVIPTLVMFTCLGKMLVSGLTQGSVKG